MTHVGFQLYGFFFFFFHLESNIVLDQWDSPCHWSKLTEKICGLKYTGGRILATMQDFVDIC